MAKMLDLKSRGCAFDFWLGRSQVVTINRCVTDCLWTGKLSPYITSHQGQLSLPPIRNKLIEHMSRGRQHCVTTNKQYSYLTILKQVLWLCHCGHFSHFLQPYLHQCNRFLQKNTEN